MTISLDEFDRALLAEVQVNARQTSEQLGESVGLSAPAVHRRLRRLREAGVIQREVAVLDAGLLGIGMTFIVSLELERERLDLMGDLKRKLAALPAVQQCYYITGKADLVLIVKVTDMDEYQRFTETALFADSNIRRFHTSVVMSEFKTGLEVPL